MTFQLTPYIMLDGKAKEAIRFYERAFDAQVLFMQTFGEGPENSASALSDDEKERVAHAVLKVGDTKLFVADEQPGHRFDKATR